MVPTRGYVRTHHVARVRMMEIKIQYTLGFFFLSWERCAASSLKRSRRPLDKDDTHSLTHSLIIHIYIYSIVFEIIPERRMQFSRKSFSNLAALESGDDSMAELQGGGPLSFGEDAGKESQASLDSEAGRRMKRYDGVGVDAWIMRLRPTRRCRVRIMHA